MDQHAFLPLSCLLLGLLWMRQVYCEDYCTTPASKQASPLKWSKPPPVLDFACVGEYRELHCCVSGYDELLWYKLVDDTWLPLKEENHERYNHNQTVRIFYPSYTEDRGKFKCVASRVDQSTGQKHTLQNVMYLDVIDDCTDWHKSPLISEPKKNITRAVSLGDNVTIPCDAFFGKCSHSDECSLNWLKVEPDFEIISRLNDSRIEQRYEDVVHDDQLLRRAILVIENVNESDFGNYKCSAMNGYPESMVFAELTKYIPPEPIGGWTLRKYVMVCSLPLIAVVIVVFSVAGPALYFKKTVDGRLYWKQHFGAFPAEDKPYDVTLVYHPEDRRFAEENIATELRNKYKYSVYERGEIQSGNELEQIGEKIKDSHCVLFIVSPEFVKDTQTMNIHRNAQHEASPSVYVVYKPVSEQTIQQAVHAGLDEETVQSLFRVMKSPDKASIWPEEGDETKGREKRISRFWKELQLLLPRIKPKDTQEPNINQHHTGAPLLQDPEPV